MDGFVKAFEKVKDATQIFIFRRDIYPKFIKDEVPSGMSQSELRHFLTRHAALKQFYKEFERRKAVLLAHGQPEISWIRCVFTNFRYRN